MPRKSDATTAATATAAATAGAGSGVGAGKDGGAAVGGDGVSIEDHTLPKSIVTRLAKGVLPQNTNVQKDAVIALSKGGTVFINYLCATANDQAKQAGRKTINPKDILEAMHIMEFDEFLPRLEAELAKFNEITTNKRALTRKNTKDAPTTTPSSTNKPSSAASTTTNKSSSSPNSDSPPAAKKVRIGSTSSSSATAAASAGVDKSAIPSRGWGDESDSAMNEDEDDEEDDEEEEDVGDEYDEVEDEEVVVGAEETGDEDGDREKGDEDEALDNGFDSD